MPGFLLGLYSAGSVALACINCPGQLLDIGLIKTGHLIQA